MRIPPFLLLPLIALAIGNAAAVESAARLGLKSEKEGDLVVVSTSEGSKLSHVTPKGLCLDQPVTAKDWTTASITFKATKDTQVRLRLSGSWVKEGQVWVLTDNLHVKGAPIANPDFENGLHKIIAPDGWKFLSENDDSKAATIVDPSLAASGKVCVKVSDSCPVIQRIPVRKDTEVTISFAARLAQ